jgi:tetratricopeptide (TPR) repeat protein
MGPLSEAQLADFTGIKRTTMRQSLGEIMQFLDEQVNGGLGKTYTLYHQSFRDYLLDEKRNVDFWCATEDGHQTIADYYWQTYHEHWDRCDKYGLLHLSDHFYALSIDPTYSNKLYELVGRPVLLTKWQRFGSLESFANDLKAAMKAASQEDPLNWVDFMRCYLIEKSLGSFKLNADVFTFVASAMARDGQGIIASSFFDQALKLALNIQDNGVKAKTFSAISKHLSQAGFLEKAKKVLDQAISETHKIVNVQERSQTIGAIVQDMARAGDIESAKDVARQALAHAQSLDFNWAKAISISSIALALSQVGEHGQAGEAFSQARKAAWDVTDNDDRAYALCAVAAAMKKAGDRNAEYVYRDAVSQFYSMGMPPEEIEDEFRNIYVDYRAESGENLDDVFAVALDIKNRNDKVRALGSVAEALAKAILYGNYPCHMGVELDIDRLYDRPTFNRIVSEEAQLPTSSEKGLTLHRLCQAILDVEVVE